MRFYKRLLCALLLCSFCLCVFSVETKASTYEHGEYHVYATVSIVGGSQLGLGMVYVPDTTRQTISVNKGVTGTSNLKLGVEYYIANTDGTALYNKGAIVKGKLENIYGKFTVAYPDVANYSLEYKSCSAYVYYADGSNDTISCTMEKASDGYYLVEFNFEAEKDVTQLMFNFVTGACPSIINGKSVTVYAKVGEPTATDEPNDNIVFNSLTSDIQSEESGWLAKIWQKLTNGFNEMVDAIVNLPAKIWEFFEDGLTSLFMPDEEYMTAYQEKWRALLADRLGAVWQVTEVIFGAWDEIDAADTRNAIEMPKVTIPLPDDNEFSFGGYNVPIVPDGFEALATAVKMIAGILCTFLFVNGLRSRYDEVMGVEK